MSVESKAKVVTTHVLYEMKQRGEKISMLTAYDYSMDWMWAPIGIGIGAGLSDGWSEW